MAAGTVAATAVRRDEQASSLRVSQAAHLAPPAANALHRKLRRVMGQADAHPPFVTADIVHPVGTHFAELLVREIVHVYGLRLALLLPLPAPILIVFHQFFLFVSTEMTGKPRSRKSLAEPLMNSN